MNKSAVALLLLFVVGCVVVVSGLVSGKPNAVAPAPAVAPVAPPPEPVARPVKRTPPAAAAVPAVADKGDPAAVMDARFTDFREEGRRLRQLLSESDPKAGQAFVNASQSPDYRALTDRRHELERAWPRASEAEKEAILAEMNAIRERTTGMVMMELGKLNAAPAAPSATPVLKSEASQRTASTPAEATKAPAAPPVVIM
ncbi:MAG: hypothetical protein RLZZ550_72 [Verrucomicrobiota bacterium]|jgi:hypothetical protein